MKKIAIVLFNLGGPSDEMAVKPFLFNLFNDQAIINLPQPLRFLIARFISSRREKFAIAEYRKIGGKSPILEETEKQARALELLLNSSRDAEYKVFIGMRYWHPSIESAASSALNFCPDEVVLLPLYPQFSTTTTGSSFNVWKKTVANTPLQNVNTQSISHYYQNDKFIEAHTKLILPVYQKAIAQGETRILFSAHGLPKKIILSGDPYQSQIECTAKAIISRLKELIENNIDYSICYQSKVGPMEWLTPDTKSEIIRANHDNKAVVIVPIAFVSEHLETLVELDIEYKKIADNIGLSRYFRVQTLRDDSLFIECLADLCRSNKVGI